jgi:hypothetical protein
MGGIGFAQRRVFSRLGIAEETSAPEGQALRVTRRFFARFMRSVGMEASGCRNRTSLRRGSGEASSRGFARRGAARFEFDENRDSAREREPPRRIGRSRRRRNLTAVRVQARPVALSDARKSVPPAVSASIARAVILGGRGWTIEKKEMEVGSAGNGQRERQFERRISTVAGSATPRPSRRQRNEASGENARRPETVIRGRGPVSGDETTVPRRAGSRASGLDIAGAESQLRGMRYPPLQQLGHRPRSSRHGARGSYAGG